MSSSPISIFFSYARKDKLLFNRLRKHLVVMRVLDHIEEWHDSAIGAGRDWRLAIDTYLNKADIIVLLFSSDFLASEHCREVEMKRALERYEVGAARVIYVLLRPVDWSGLPLDSINFLPSDGNPISLWRNRELAFLEVAKGIRKVVDELAERVVGSFMHGPNFPLWDVPYRRNLYFTGREEHLTLLHSYFASGSTLHTRIQALNGLAGIGKTQIAIEYAYRYQQEYQAVFWIRGSSSDVFRSDLLALADKLSLPKKELGGESQLVSALQRYLQFHEQWLLLIDDLADFHYVDLLVPLHCKGHVLLTSRSQAKGTSIHALPVPPMTLDEGALFLLRRAKLIEEQALFTAALPADYTHSLAVVHEVDRFPLALDQAGAYIEETGRSLTDYLALYRHHRPQLLQRRGYFVDSHPQSVSATLTLTFEQVTQAHPQGVTLFETLSTQQECNRWNGW